MFRIDQQSSTALFQTDLLRAPPNTAFNRITRVAAMAFGVPSAAVSLTDETCQWLTSHEPGTPAMIPRADAPCFMIASTGHPLAIRDLQLHEDYQTGLLTQLGIRFYAGAPLISGDGRAIGTICVMGPNPREATAAEMTVLGDLAELVMAEIELRRAGGRIDPLSGLPNRQQLLEELTEIARVEPGKHRVLGIIDLARPDELSHMLHSVGSAYLDDMVRREALSLHATLGPDARLYHVGSTQFALIAPCGTDATTFACHLQNRMPHAQCGRDAAFSTTCTIGLALVIPSEASPADLLRRAYAALDDARARRAPIGMFSPDQDAAFRRAFTLLNDFPNALADEHSLCLVFQPRLDLASGRCIGAEALLRWRHPILGEIPPGEFVRLIEKTTMARTMMHWVLATALQQQRVWRNSGLHLQLSVNVSPANLEEPDFAAHVLAALAEAGLPPASLELEITENALLDETSPAMHQLRALSEAGIRIAIDDFGTGYSSLSYLQRLPADVVKIDQSFIRGLTGEGADEGRRRTMVTALIGLSHDLGYRVVAEGIETQAAADVLLGLQCDEVQGYHFARPMPPSTFASWLAKHHWLTKERLEVAIDGLVIAPEVALPSRHNTALQTLHRQPSQAAIRLSVGAATGPTPPKRQRRRPAPP